MGACASSPAVDDIHARQPAQSNTTNEVLPPAALRSCQTATTRTAAGKLNRTSAVDWGCASTSCASRSTVVPIVNGRT